MLDGGSISCKVTDPHHKYSSDLVQGGLKISYIITLQGTKELIDKARKLLTISSKIDITATDEKPTSKEVAAIAPAPNAKRIKCGSKCVGNISWDKDTALYRG